MRFAFLLSLLIFSSAHAAPQPPAFRLGNGAAPLGYAATLAIDPRAERFSGEVRIRLRFERPAPVLWLNATGLAIESAEFRQGAQRVAVTVLPGGEDFVGFEGRFAAGEALATIRYSGAFEPLSTRGLFRQQDRDEWYVLSQFEAIHARRAFPCFDEPGWKTPWQLTIDTPSANVAVSNTPQTRALPAPRRPGWTRHVFAETRPLPSYLVALAVGPFDVVDGGTAGARRTPLRFLAPKGRGAELRYAVEATPRLLEILEEYFGMPYPFEKLDAVSIPQTIQFGAMENVGMITYGASLLLATPREETGPFRRRYAAIAAHEIAHMWFGNLVTLDWWDDVWLNEAFASWMGAKALARFRPEWDNAWSLGWTRRNALDLDRLESARRVRNPVREKNDIPGAFDSITYNKGAAVLAMFENWFGEERFRQGVQRFVRRHAYGTAGSEDFVRALGEASGRGAEALAVFRGFIEQPGVPLVDVALACNAAGASVALEQQRLRPAGSSSPNARWTTPVCMRHAEGRQCVDIQDGANTVVVQARGCPAWLAANAGGESYYVPRYQASLAQALRAQGPLSAHEMVSAITDAGILADSGLVPVAEALAWADAGLAHPSPVARSYAAALLRSQREPWLDERDRATKRAVVERRLLPLAAELGWKERAGESDEVRELRANLLPFAAQSDLDGGLRAEARELAAAWMAERNAVPATLTRAVLETAGRFADAALYARLEAAALGSVDLRERHYLLSALSVVRDERLRPRALALALHPEVSARDARGFLDSALADDWNRSAAFDFLREHFDALVARLPQHSMARLMDALAGLCTPAERAQFAAFFASRAADFLGGPLAYRQALERIDLCIAAHSVR